MTAHSRQATPYSRTQCSASRSRLFKTADAKVRDTEISVLGTNAVAIVIGFFINMWVALKRAGCSCAIVLTAAAQTGQCSVMSRCVLRNARHDADPKYSSHIYSSRCDDSISAVVQTIALNHHSTLFQYASTLLVHNPVNWVFKVAAMVHGLVCVLDNWD